MAFACFAAAGIIAVKVNCLEGGSFADGALKILELR